MIILIVEIESSLLSIGPVSGLVHVDTLVLTEEMDLLIAINEKINNEFNDITSYIL